jgi:DNA-directed RNA polymerase subunit RPC12/RpoP
MPRQVVFPCSSCGASLSVDENASTAQCQFCGSTVAVPQALRGSAPIGSSTYGTPNPGPGTAGPGFGTDQSQLGAIGDAVRAGNKSEAARLYQARFGVGQMEAQRVVEQLAAGQSVQVGTTATGMPEYLQVSPVAPSAPYYVPMMTPVIPDANRIFRGVMGFNIALTIGIFLFTACIIVFVFVAVGLAFVPALFGGLGPLFNR